MATYIALSTFTDQGIRNVKDTAKRAEAIAAAAKKFGATMITTTYLNDTSATLPPRLEVRRGTGYDATHETLVAAEANGFLAEADAFADLVRHGWSRWPGATPEESADTVRILEALAESALEGGAVDIAP